MKLVGNARVQDDQSRQRTRRITAQFWGGILVGLVGAIALGLCWILLMPDRFAAEHGPKPTAAVPAAPNEPDLEPESQEDSPSASSAQSQAADMPQADVEVEQALWEQETIADAEEFARDVLSASVPVDRQIDEALRMRANSVSRFRLPGWAMEVRRIRALCAKLRGSRILTPYRDLRGEFVPTCEEQISIR